MLRLRDAQESLWDHLLPPQVRTLSDELATVDAWLSDERFFKPYQERFYTHIGRPTVPVETYLRLMYLRHRYGFGYETLVREVADSLHWRRFCHIALEDVVPHPTTLSKLTGKYGPDVVQELNQLLVRKASERRVVRSRKLRLDTTVIQAPILRGLCEWWTRTQRIRTAGELPFEAILADAAAAPIYQRIASKALHLQQLRLGPAAIARRLGTDRKTVAKALTWLARPRQAP